MEFSIIVDAAFVTGVLDQLTTDQLYYCLLSYCERDAVGEEVLLAKIISKLQNQKPVDFGVVAKLTKIFKKYQLSILSETAGLWVLENIASKMKTGKQWIGCLEYDLPATHIEFVNNLSYKERHQLLNSWVGKYISTEKMQQYVAERAEVVLAETAMIVAQASYCDLAAIVEHNHATDYEISLYKNGDFLNKISNKTYDEVISELRKFVI